MRQVLHVEVKNYDIVISDDKFSKLMEEIDSLTAGRKRMIVTSRKVYKLYKKELSLYEDEVFVLKDGEKEKNFKNYIKILENASLLGLTREDVMIALGGGVIGDITGFAASTYMRGIDYIQVPTTLLSMVDSSVGGKTAVDMKDAKNIAGTFYQPKAVFININFLKTLDKKQFNSGIGEILKYAFIEESCHYNTPLFLLEYLTLCCEKFLSHDSTVLIRVIECCLNLKISVVNQDEQESGIRKILNFGHTLGHALEVITGYRKYTHGEAVVSGIYFILDWAYKDGRISNSYYVLSTELLSKYGFENYHIAEKYNPSELIKLMKKDKKAVKDKITFIVPCNKKKVEEVQFTPEETAGMF